MPSQRNNWEMVKTVLTGLFLIASLFVFWRLWGSSYEHSANTESATEAEYPGSVALLGEASQVQLGILSRNEEKTYQIGLRNTLGRDLNIINSNVSCGCVKVIELPRVIEPGEIGIVTFSVNPSSSNGRLVQKILVFTDSADAAKSVFSINVTANIRGVFCTKGHLYFCSVTSHFQKTKIFTVSVIGYKRAELISASCDNTNFVVSPLDKVPILSEISHGQRGKSVDHGFEVRISPDAEVGSHLGVVQVVVETEDGESEVSVELHATVSGLIACTPSTLVWTNVTDGDLVQGEVELVIKAGDIGNLKLKPSDEAVSASLIESEGQPPKVNVRWSIHTSSGMRMLKASVTGQNENDVIFTLPMIALVQSIRPLESK